MKLMFVTLLSLVAFSVGCVSTPAPVSPGNPRSGQDSVLGKCILAQEDVDKSEARAKTALTQGADWVYDVSVNAYRYVTSDEMMSRYHRTYEAAKDTVKQTYDATASAYNKK